LQTNLTGSVKNAFITEAFNSVIHSQFSKSQMEAINLSFSSLSIRVLLRLGLVWKPLVDYINTNRFTFAVTESTHPFVSPPLSYELIISILSNQSFCDNCFVPTVVSTKVPFLCSGDLRSLILLRLALFRAFNDQVRDSSAVFFPNMPAMDAFSDFEAMFIQCLLLDDYSPAKWESSQAFIVPTKPLQGFPDEMQSAITRTLTRSRENIYQRSIPLNQLLAQVLLFCRHANAACSTLNATQKSRLFEVVWLCLNTDLLWRFVEYRDTHDQCLTPFLHQLLIGIVGDQAKSIASTPTCVSALGVEISASHSVHALCASAVSCVSSSHNENGDLQWAKGIQSILSRMGSVSTYSNPDNLMLPSTICQSLRVLRLPARHSIYLGTFFLVKANFLGSAVDKYWQDRFNFIFKGGNEDYRVILENEFGRTWNDLTALQTWWAENSTLPRQLNQMKRCAYSVALRTVDSLICVGFRQMMGAFASIQWVSPFLSAFRSQICAVLAACRHDGPINDRDPFSSAHTDMCIAALSQLASLDKDPDDVCGEVCLLAVMVAQYRGFVSHVFILLEQNQLPFGFSVAHMPAATDADRKLMKPGFVVPHCYPARIMILRSQLGKNGRQYEFVVPDSVDPSSLLFETSEFTSPGSSLESVLV
jgi:hypothetical protein